MSELSQLAIRLSGATEPRRSVELAVRAEARGFDSVWFAENLFERGILPAAAASAAVTRRVRIGLGVLILYNRHPTLAAMEAAALDELSEGRAIVGIGAGIPDLIRHFGAPNKPTSALRDTVRIMRALLAGEEVHHAGEVFSADGVKLGFPRTAAPVPIFVAAMADRSLRVCGELADGLVISNMCPLAFSAHAKKQMQAGAEAAARPAQAEIVKYVPCAVRATTAEAEAAIKPVLGAMLIAYWRLLEALPKARAVMARDNGVEPERFAAALRRLSDGEPAAEILDDAFVTAYSVTGTLEDCMAQCHELHRTGATEIALSFVGDNPEAAIDLFGDAVAGA